jgi:hypothetical protein
MSSGGRLQRGFSGSRVRRFLQRQNGDRRTAQGKLPLEFVPVTHYATVTAIEAVP